MGGWASPLVDKLLAKETVQFRPRGNSMTGRIESGQLVTVAPVNAALNHGDIVLCSVRGAIYLHIIKQGPRDDGKYLIGNNRGRINGWTKVIFGRVTKVES